MQGMEEQPGAGRAATGQRPSVLDPWLGQAARAGNRPALRDPDVTYTHRQLLDHAHRRAAFLVSQGLGPDQRVVVLLSSGAEQAAWISAVMLAGGCAVPIGLNQPEHRLRTLVALARPAAVIADQGTWALADGQVRYDGSARGTDPHGPLHRAGPDLAAYMCFTSGTTGDPKGVVVTHGVLAHVTREMVAYLGLSRRPRTHVLATSWSFDVAMMDLWLALTSGGTLFMPGRHALLGPALPVTMSALRAPVLHTVPSLFRGSSGSDIAAFPDGTTVMVGGEPVPAALLGPLAEHTDLHVVYGITETGIITTAAPAGRGTTPDIIGRPLPGTECVVADATGQEVNDGEPGELLIGGPVVARGYLGDPAGTAARFLPHQAGTRRYRTGDLVRRGPDGNLSFRGRIDQQLKIRGHRVEPAEVERAVLSLAGVRQAAIVAREDPSGELALIAYLTGEDLDAGQVRQELSARMPDWMCPRAVEILPALPVSTTGKIDRGMLPEPHWAGTPGADGAEPVQGTPTERVIGEVWQHVLGTAAVAADASFLDLGGHSLKAAQVSTALRDQLGVSVPVPDVLSLPTLRDLAQLVDRLAGTPPEGETGAARDGSPEAPAIQRQIWLHQEMAGLAGIYNLIVTVRLNGPVQPLALQRSLHAVERIHPALRTSFTFDGDRLIAAERPAAARPLAIRRADLAAAIRDAGARTLDLSGAPPWRYELLATGPSESVLLLVFHHIAVDGVAIHRLLTEIAQHYSGFAGDVADVRPGSGPSRPPGRDAAALDGDARFWTALMNGAPEPAMLPGQRDPGGSTDYSGWCRPAELAGIQAGALRQAAAARGVTAHTLLLAAFVRTIAAATGLSDVIIGVTLSRRGIDVDVAAVGQFAAVLPVRFRLPADLAPGACLDAVARTTREVQRHCAVDPAVAVEAARSQQGRAAGDPVFIVFAWEDDLPALNFAGLESSWALEFSGWSSSQLTLELGRRGDRIAGRVIGRQQGSADVDVTKVMRQLTENVTELIAGASDRTGR